MIVGRFDTELVNEGPERCLVIQDIRARARHTRDLGGGDLREHRLELTSLEPIGSSKRTTRSRLLGDRAGRGARGPSAPE